MSRRILIAWPLHTCTCIDTVCEYTHHEQENTDSPYTKVHLVDALVSILTAEGAASRTSYGLPAQHASYPCG